MKSLEELTRHVFSNWVRFKTGKTANWNKLSEERREVWLNDVNFIVENVLDSLLKDMKIEPINKAPQASYELGYVRGSETEKHRLRHLITEMKNKYKSDLG